MRTRTRPTPDRTSYHEPSACSLSAPYQARLQAHRRPGGAAHLAGTASLAGRAANHVGAANDNVVRYPRAESRPESYGDSSGLLYFIDRCRFARAIAARDPGSKPTKCEHIAYQTGINLYDAVISMLKHRDRDIYRLYLRFGLGSIYNDIRCISRRRLVPYIDRLIAERRMYAAVPGEIIDTLADTISEGLRREYCVNIDRVA